MKRKSGRTGSDKQKNFLKGATVETSFQNCEKAISQQKLKIAYFQGLVKI